MLGVMLGCSLTIGFASSKDSVQVSSHVKSLNYQGIGEDTMNFDKVMSVAAPTAYISTNEAHLIDHLQKLISQQQIYKERLGIKNVVNWNQIDSKTIEGLKDAEEKSPITAELLKMYNNGKPTEILSRQFEIDGYIANLMTLAEQNQQEINEWVK